MANLNPRVAVSALGFSLVAFVALVGHEDYVGEAMVPTKGDRPTIGLGSTFWPDGSPVRMGEKITPRRAIEVAAAHVSKEERAFQNSLPGVKLHLGEYDLYMDWVYQYGSPAWMKSSMRQSLLAGSYYAACKDLLKYRFAAGYDCSTPGNRRCAGVWSRQLDRFAVCYSLQ